MTQRGTQTNSRLSWQENLERHGPVWFQIVSNQIHPDTVLTEVSQTTPKLLKLIKLRYEQLDECVEFETPTSPIVGVSGGGWRLGHGLSPRDSDDDSMVTKRCQRVL